MLTALTLVALLAYLAASFLFLAGMVGDRPLLSRIALGLVWVGLAGHVASLGAQVADDGAASLFAMPVGLSSVALLLVAGFLALERIYDLRPVGTLVAPLAAILLGGVLPAEGGRAASGRYGALLEAHVSLAFVGTVAFALAFVLALLYAVQDHQLRSKQFGVLYRRLPPLTRLDTAGYRCISIGFPFYTGAILLGVVSAFRQEQSLVAANFILALLTWLLYGTVLQARLSAGWRGRKAAFITIAGFLTAAGVVIVYLV